MLDLAATQRENGVASCVCPVVGSFDVVIVETPLLAAAEKSGEALVNGYSAAAPAIAVGLCRRTAAPGGEAIGIRGDLGTCAARGFPQEEHPDFPGVVRAALAGISFWRPKDPQAPCAISYAVAAR